MIGATTAATSARTSSCSGRVLCRPVVPVLSRGAPPSLPWAPSLAAVHSANLERPGYAATRPVPLSAIESASSIALSGASSRPATHSAVKRSSPRLDFTGGRNCSFSATSIVVGVAPIASSSASHAPKSRAACASSPPRRHDGAQALEALGGDALVAALLGELERVGEELRRLGVVVALAQRDAAEVRERERHAPRVAELAREREPLLQVRGRLLVVAARQLGAAEREHASWRSAACRRARGAASRLCS